MVGRRPLKNLLLLFGLTSSGVAQTCSPTDKTRFPSVIRTAMCVFDADGTFTTPITTDGAMGTFLIYAAGGTGGTADNGGGAPGGLGGYISGHIALAPGRVIDISLGGNAVFNAGGKNGGGNANHGEYPGGGGGGATIVKIVGGSSSLTAGGGGGGGIIAPQNNFMVYGGHGGIGLAPAQAGTSHVFDPDTPDNTQTGGQGATTTGGGAAGLSNSNGGFFIFDASPGALGVGGDSAHDSQPFSSGGGGGGGVYGGGGGGDVLHYSSSPAYSTGGGGGGSSGITGGIVLSNPLVVDHGGVDGSTVIIFFDATSFVSGVPNHRKKKRSQIPISLCPKTEERACSLPSGGYECLDPNFELTSCGGCASEGTGQDCLTIPYAQGVYCEGRCVVMSCSTGFEVSEGKSECLPVGPTFGMRL